MNTASSWFLPGENARQNLMLIAALVLSLLAHMLWLLQTNLQEMPVMSGGGSKLPMAVSIALQKQPAVENPPIENPDPVKEVVESKPEIEKKLVKPLPKKIEKRVPEILEEILEPSLIEELVEVTTVEQMVSSQVIDEQPAAIPVITEAQFSSPPIPPSYPDLALRRKQQGEALVRALINEQGKTETVELFRSTGYRMLDEAALTAVRKWSFQAALVDGRAIKAWVEVPVSFEINR